MVQNWYTYIIYDTDPQGFVVAAVLLFNMILCESLCWYFISLAVPQEICVSNHAQKQQKRQTIHKDSIAHQVLQVDGFL